MKTHNYRFKQHEIGVFESVNSNKAVEGFDSGCHIMGLTMGQFSLIDLIHSVLKKTGPADLYIATWSAGIKDAYQVRWMLDTDLIRGVRLLTDHSYVNRQKKYAASIEELFGKENIRTSEIHAKFVLIGNEDYHVSIISSMNLNANRTCENFQIYESDQIYGFYKDFVQSHFSNMANGWERSSRIVNEHIKEYFRKNSQSSQCESDPFRYSEL